MAMRIHPELPIYALAGPGGTVLLYTPGTLAVGTDAQADLLRRAWSNGTAIPGDEPPGFPEDQAGWLLEHARNAMTARNQWLAEEYRPECLTVYVSNQCTLRCSYCFAAPTRTGRAGVREGVLLRADAFAAAAEVVGRNCADKGRGFQLACHGGGEPSLHWDLVQRLAAISKAVAGRHGVPWSGYIATNGVVSLKRAGEMAAVFGRVGLSCDGPPDIQDRQRPSSGGAPTSGRVRRTAAALKEAGARLDLRATITPDTVSRQAEILEYLVAELGADSVTFEPVYGPRPGGGGNRDRDPDPDPEEWAGHFMRARQEAGRRNVALAFSGFRPEERHGPYCNTLRQSLHLTPDGRATNCFLLVDGGHPDHNEQIIGGFDPAAGRFVLDQARIASLRERAGRIASRCRDCFAAHHCARSCPDACPPHDGYEEPPTTAAAPFRCRLNRAMGHALLGEAALDLLREEAGTNAADAAAIVSGLPRPAIQETEREAGQAARQEAGQSGAPDARPDVWPDVWPAVRQEVLQIFEASHPHYRPESRGLPQPLWETKGFHHDGEATWNRLRRIVNGQSSRPFSMYVHIPFCEKRCGFCDCHAVSAGPGHPLHAGYVRRLLLDLRQWSEQTALAAWPVTTIHFGGGTPGVLGPSLFASVVEAVRAGFHTTASTEWALESTAGQITGPHLDFLRDLGFRRLHIGVQTLEEPLRREIGRRLPPETVLERIAGCLARDFVTTVDLLYGLPGQTNAGFFSGIERLDRLGVHGLSLYRFNPSRRNRGFLRRHRHAPDAVRDFSLFAAADAALARAGYEKNHFCHYARPEDQNLYYTHARRGEDLLALGASADGVFANLHYRSPELSRAFLDTSRNRPLFQGSVADDEGRSPRAAIAKHLMTGSVPKELFLGNGLEGLLDRWRGCLLVREKENAGGLLGLTAGGSWHLCAMLEELEGLR